MSTVRASFEAPVSLWDFGSLVVLLHQQSYGLHKIHDCVDYLASSPDEGGSKALYSFMHYDCMPESGTGILNAC